MSVPENEKMRRIYRRTNCGVDTISKEQVAELPLETFRGDVVVVDHVEGSTGSM
jgi:hypothetical protein